MEPNPTKPKRARRPKLTRKQRVFVAEYAVSGNGAGAAKKAYEIQGSNENKIAASIATENLAKPGIQDAVEVAQESLKDALISEEITPNFIAKKVKVLLEAEKPVFEMNEDGVYENVGNEVDFNAVDKGLKHATAIYGIVPDSPKQVSNVTYNFLFSSETQESIKLINQKIKEKLIHA